MPAASIILPVRNASATLAEAIGSSLAQTEASLELLVVLNGCTDGSREIADAWAVEDSRVRILVSPSSEGVVGAANLGAAHARGDVLLRMDADDRAAPDRVEVQLRSLTENPDWAAVAGRVEVTDPLGEGMKRYVDWVNQLGTLEKIAVGRFIESPVINPSTAIRRTVFNQLGGYHQTSWAEDHDLWLRLLAGGCRIGKIPDVVIFWRDSRGRLTRTDPRYGEEQVWEMKAHHLSRLPGVKRYGAVIAGAGPIGKRLARLLRDREIEMRGFFEVNPRRIGQRIAGRDVCPATWMGRQWRDAILLGAVGIPGGREKVRQAATSAGYREGEDFWSVC